MLRLSVTATVGLLAIAVPSALRAQPPVSAEPERRSGVSDGTAALATGSEPAPNGDIVVTARRTTERLQDVPISITVFNQAQLSARNIINAGDLAAYTPSLSSNGRFGAENTSFAIRGFTQDAGTTPSVGVYFAEVGAPRSTGNTTAGEGSGPGNFFDLQNVQVLKGPQGTLFGRNTTGGAVLLVPQKPTARLEGYVEGSLGDYGMHRLQAVLNAPLTSWARLRVGIDWNQRNGFLKNHSGIGPNDFGDVNYVATRASLVLDLAPNLENYTIGSYSRSDTHGSIPRLIACNPASFPLGQAACDQLARQAARGDGYYDVENGNISPRLLLKTSQVINTTTWKAADTLTIRNIASYGRFSQAYRANIFGENLFLPATLTVGTATIRTGQYAGAPIGFTGLANYPGLDYIDQYTATEEFQLQGRARGLTWQVGAYFEDSGPARTAGIRQPVLISCADPNRLQCTDVLGILLGRPTGSINQRFLQTHFRDVGLYAQATYDISDRLSATGGFRYTWDRTRTRGDALVIRFPAAGGITGACANTLAFGNRPTLDATACRQRFEQKTSAPTWTIDLDYKPVRDLLVFAKYARGYRQGSIAPFSPGFERFNAEKVDDYEIGVKATLGGPIRGTFNVTGFYNDFSNQQLSANAIAKTGSGVSNTNTIINAGRSRIEGVEVDTVINLTRHFTVEAAYAYLSTKLKSIVLPAIDPASPFARFELTAVAGGPLILSPKNKVTVTPAYTLPLPEAAGTVTAGITFTHTDSQVATAASPFGRLPATNLFNLNLGWRSIFGSAVDASLFVTNLTNVHYPTFVSGSYTSVGFDGFVIGPPRMIGGRVRVRFGG